MIDKAWYNLMGLANKAFNKNFFVAVVLVLLGTNITAFYFWNESIKQGALDQKHCTKELLEADVRNHNDERRNDSIRTLELRYFKTQYDSLNKVVFQILREKR